MKTFNKTKTLEILFDKWEEAQLNESTNSLSLTLSGKNIRKDFFQRDGIIDEPTYDKEKIKVLFISSEANADEYSAASNIVKTNYVKEYLDYYKTGIDKWRGKMRERISAIYGSVTNQNNIEFHQLANKFAIMDLNKRGGTSTIDSGRHIIEYVKLYKHFIIKEIEIIDPDFIIWIGTNTYNLGIPELLGSIKKSTNKFFFINNRYVPIVKMWQTSYYQSKIQPLPGYKNKTIGKLCAKAKLELSKFDKYT